MKNTLILSAIALLFSGCNTSEIDNTATSEIAFSLKNIVGMNTRAGYDTPSDITSADPGFGVYIVNDPADLLSSGNRADNHSIKFNGTTWFNKTTETSGTKLEWPETGTVSAFAYCPFQAGIKDNNNIVVETKEDQSTLASLKASDFLGTKSFNCQKSENGTIPLTFSHQLSKLKFNITWSNQNDVGILSSLEINSVRQQGTYNLLTGIVTPNGNKNGNSKSYIYNQTSTSATAEIILIPQEISKGAFVTIITQKDGQDKYYVLNLTSNLILDSNTQYNFNITLKPGVEESEVTTIDPSPASVERWDEVDKGEWDLSANEKKQNILKVSFGEDVRGLTLVITPTLPLHDNSDISIFIDPIKYVYGRLAFPAASVVCSNLEANNLCGAKHKLSICTKSSDNSTSVDDAFMSYRIEPSEIYIPASVHITPVYDESAGTIILSASQNVESDITYKVFQRENQNSTEIETVSVNAVIRKGTTQSQAINVSSWNKAVNALVSLTTKASDTIFPKSRMIRENVYYKLEGSLWGSSFGETNHELHIVL